MADINGLMGGFVAANSGKIEDCYCIIASASKKQRKCFSGVNTGEIRSSFGNYKGEFVEQWDNLGKTNTRTVRNRSDASSLGYDTENVWEYVGEKLVLIFKEKTWYVSGQFVPERKVLHIKTLEDLEKFCEFVSSGDKRVTCANIKLENDIDCKGKSLSPIGANRLNAFCGVFDGGGHAIRNFKIEGSQIGNYGFFGYLKGTVLNLTLDCSVKAEGNIGAICGVNEGTISCCGAVVDLNGSGDKLNMGGLVGQNSGRIEKSYAAVRLHVVPIPIIPIGIAAAVVVFLGTVAFVAIPASKAANQTYAPIESDGNQIKIQDSDEAVVSEVNSISFKFDETLHIDPDDGRCYLNFENPSYATNKIILSLEVEKSDGSRVTIARSGAIEPGYGLAYLSLNDEGYEMINSGITEGYIELTPYDKSTDDLSMVQTELPVKITIE